MAEGARNYVLVERRPDPEVHDPVFLFSEGTLAIEPSFEQFAGSPDAIDVEDGVFDLLFDRLGGRVVYTVEERPRRGWLRWLGPRLDVDYHYVAPTQRSRQEFAVLLRAHLGLSDEQLSLDELIERALAATPH